MNELIWEALRISFKKVWIYRFEFLMTFIHLFFNLLFVLLFWSGITQTLNLPLGWTSKEIYVFSAFIMVSDAISEIFFANHMLPYKIHSGELDLYLVRPQNLTTFFTMDHINIIAVTESILIAVIFLGVALFYYGPLRISMLLLALLFLLVGTFIVQMLFAMISMLSFWFGIIDHIRYMLFSVKEFAKYPLGFFHKAIRKVLTYCIPLAFISYYPIELYTGKQPLSISIVLLYCGAAIGFYMVFQFVKRKGLEYYESNN